MRGLRVGFVRHFHEIDQPADPEVTAALEHVARTLQLEAAAPRRREVDIVEDDRFICSHAMFRRWADGRQSFRMEYFYREMRRYTGLLMDGAGPVGGQWNFDAENRLPCPPDLKLPQAPEFAPDAITLDVIRMVQQQFAGHMGQAEHFSFAVTGKDARAAFLHFVQYRLPLFGKYQDAMRQDEAFLFHSLAGMYLNCGLLDARWVCLQVEQAWKAGAVPLAAAIQSVASEIAPRRAALMRGCSPAITVTISSRVTQSASSSSAGSILITSSSASAWQPNIRFAGKGHGCEAT